MKEGLIILVVSGVSGIMLGAAFNYSTTWKVTSWEVTLYNRYRSKSTVKG